ncbi:MAG TPA: hypothetical protein VGB73_02860 [Pyrinomonadaceae bacterium]|jgi:hypothetical protein
MLYARRRCRASDSQFISDQPDDEAMKTKAELPEIVESPCWEVSPVDFYEFLRQLPHLFPSNSVLCLEGVDVPRLAAYLRKRPAAYENELNQGWLNMRPKIFYMPITEENLQGFAALSERYAEPEVCSHLRVYRNDKIILSWHDLPSDPFYVANEIDEAALRKFCSALGCEYVVDAEVI